MKLAMIAPCGMNCSLCMARFREKRKCPGCRGGDENKSPSCIKCVIKNCPILSQSGWKFCSEKCERYPCLRLRNLDKRYRTKYGMSMIENLENIQKYGIRKFIEMEKSRWIRGDEIFCVHKKKYFRLEGYASSRMGSFRAFDKGGGVI